jgi:DNA-binding NtrC family response regulator
MSIQRILVVDDDTLSRQFLVEAIAALGYQAIEAKSGREALERAQSSNPDLVMTDMRIPGVDGIELVRNLKTHYPELPAVMVAGEGTIESAIKALRNGAEDFLLKPCTPEAIEAVIDRIERISRLVRENEYLRSEVGGQAPSSMVAKSPVMTELMRTAAHVARSKGHVTITGESGAGKGRVAHYIHQNGPHSSGPFIRVNCAAHAGPDLEIELFGSERGSTASAHKPKQGRFEIADGGTLLLEEFGGMTPALQSKLLHFFEHGEYQRVHGTHTLKSEARVIVSTSRDLAADMRAGKLREDLYYKLQNLAIHVPPLREHREDVAPLAQHFAQFYAQANGLPAPQFTKDALDRLNTWNWPGNVNELESVIQRAVVVLRHTTIDAADFVFGTTSTATPATPVATDASGTGGAPTTPQVPTSELSASLANRTIEEIERVAILATLQSTRGNKTEAARRLGVTARTLSNKMKLWRSTGLVA